MGAQALSLAVESALHLSGTVHGHGGTEMQAGIAEAVICVAPPVADVFAPDPAATPAYAPRLARYRATRSQGRSKVHNRPRFH